MSLVLLSKNASLFEYFGLAVFGYVALRLALRVLSNLGTFFLGLGAVNLKSYGSWAVVTGCTDGIGKAYAELLAKRGLNVVLISRTLEKLQDQAKQLQEKYKVETKVIAADFTEPNTIYPKIKSELETLDVAILVNNVGVSYQYPEFFDVFAQNERTVSDMINCNIMSVTKMTAIVLPGMVAKKKGIIVNNASASGRIPTPLLAVYSASKAYVDFFARSLDLEYRSSGILVQSICPFFVSTKLSAMRSSFTTPKPNEYVSSALNTLSTQSVTNGCLIHNLQGWFFENVIGASLYGKLALNSLKTSRNKAIAKLKRQAAQKKD